MDGCIFSLVRGTRWCYAQILTLPVKLEEIANALMKLGKLIVFAKVMKHFLTSYNKSMNIQAYRSDTWIFFYKHSFIKLTYVTMNFSIRVDNVNFVILPSCWCGCLCFTSSLSGGKRAETCGHISLKFILSALSLRMQRLWIQWQKKEGRWQLRHLLSSPYVSQLILALKIVLLVTTIMESFRVFWYI